MIREWYIADVALGALLLGLCVLSPRSRRTQLRSDSLLAIGQIFPSLLALLSEGAAPGWIMPFSLCFQLALAVSLGWSPLQKLPRFAARLVWLTPALAWLPLTALEEAVGIALLLAWSREIGFQREKLPWMAAAFVGLALDHFLPGFPGFSAVYLAYALRRPEFWREIFEAPRQLRPLTSLEERLPASALNLKSDGGLSFSAHSQLPLPHEIHFRELLVRGFDPETVKAMESHLQACFRLEKSDSWPLGPHFAEWQEGSRPRLSLEMSWHPLWSETGQLNEVLLILQDVSSLNPANREIESPQDQLIITELKAVSLQDFSDYMQGSSMLAQEIKQLIEGALHRDEAVLRRSYIKSRLVYEASEDLGLKIMSQAVRRFLETLQHQIQTPSAPWHPFQLVQDLEALRKQGRTYLRLNVQALGRRLEDAARSSFDRSIPSLKQALSIDGIPLFHQVQARADAALESIAWSDLLPALQEMTERLGRLTYPGGVSCHCEGDMSLQLSLADVSHLQFALEPLLQNAMQYGSSVDSAAFVRLSYRLTARADGFELSLRDGGRGLSLSRLRDLMDEDGLVDLQKQVTIDEVALYLLNTEWRSGRGLLRAQTLLGQLGISLSLRLHREHMREGYCPFSLLIQIPAARLRTPTSKNLFEDLQQSA